MEENMGKFIKKFSCILLAVIAVFQIAITVGAADSPVIRVSEAKGGPGQEVSVTISFENNPGIAGYKLTLTYDSSRLEFIWEYDDKGKIKVPMSGILPVTELNTKEEGRAIIVGHQTGNTAANGKLFELRFKIKDDAGRGEISGEKDFKLDYVRDADIANAEKQSVNPTIIQGKITVGNTAEANTTVAELLEKYPDGAHVFNKDGAEISEDDFIGTGSYVTMGGADDEKILLITIDYELTGDGRINKDDITAALNYIKTSGLELPANLSDEIFNKAANLSAGNRIDIEDVMNIYLNFVDSES
jgi:hypothetical protein